MSVKKRSFGRLSVRLAILALALASLNGCAAVAVSLAMIPVQLASQTIAQSAQEGINIAAASVRAAIDENQ